LGTEELARQARAVEPESVKVANLGNELFDRLLAYIALRTSQRYSARFVRQQAEANVLWFTAYVEEMQVLIAQFEDLANLRGRSALRAESKDSLVNSYKLISKAERIALHRDHYSPSCALNFPTFDETAILSKPLGDGIAGIALMERSAETLPADRYDIVIGDPPYGFNTVEETESLAKLYREFIGAALSSLRDGGDLILCLPERSHSGRYSPAFTHRELVVHELYLRANEAKRELIFPRDGVRGGEALHSSDYYWESPKALRRSVIHVRVRHLPTQGGPEVTPG
jgi:hypothetical protein